MKVIDIIDQRFDDYDDIEVFEFTSGEHVIQENNIRRIDDMPSKAYLDAEVIEQIPMTEAEYNNTIFSNGNDYRYFGEKKTVLCVFVSEDWADEILIPRLKTLVLRFDLLDEKDYYLLYKIQNEMDSPEVQIKKILSEMMQSLKEA